MSLHRGGRPTQRLRERKYKVWVWRLSSPGPRGDSIHANKLFSCLQNTARFISIIENGIKHTWYIIKHIHFFLIFFLPQAAASLHRDQWCPSPFNQRPRLFPLQRQILTKLSAFRGSRLFFFQSSNSIQKANAGTRGYIAGHLFSSLVIRLFFCFFTVWKHAIQIWTHADRKVWHCTKSAKMFSSFQT